MKGQAEVAAKPGSPIVHATIPAAAPQLSRNSRLTITPPALSGVDVQVHGLFPPPAVWYYPSLLLALPAFVKNWVVCHVHCDCLPTDIHVLLQCAHPTLFQCIL
jgi:hypothetical protein